MSDLRKELLKEAVTDWIGFIVKELFVMAFWFVIGVSIAFTFRWIVG